MAPPAPDRPDHIRRCFSVAVERLLERYPPGAGWTHAATVEPGRRYEVSAARDGHGFVAGFGPPDLQPLAALDSPGPAFTGCLIKLGGFVLGGGGAATLALVAPGPAPAGQLALLGAFFGAMIGWLVSLVAVGVLSARNPFPRGELEAIGAELAALEAGPSPAEVDLLALARRRFDLALARQAAAPDPATRAQAFEEACDMSVLARCVSPLYGDAREAEVADLVARREQARGRRC